jgi:hypothetical protein
VPWNSLNATDEIAFIINLSLAMDFTFTVTLDNIDKISRKSSTTEYCNLTYKISFIKHEHQSNYLKIQSNLKTDISSYR